MPSDRGIRRIGLRMEEGRFEFVDDDEIFSIEADGHDAVVRTRSKKVYRSTGRLAKLAERLTDSRFFSPHRSWVVNLDRVREVRRRDNSDEWELKLDPPVNTVIPVARDRKVALFHRLGIDE
jgi:two-component system response regulator LytT